MVHLPRAARQHQGLHRFFPGRTGTLHQNFGLVPPTPVQPWCRPSSPSITLSSASDSIDSLWLRSTSWTEGGARSRLYGREVAERGLESGYCVAAKARPEEASPVGQSQDGRRSTGERRGPATKDPLTSGLAAGLLRMRSHSPPLSQRPICLLAHARPILAAEGL